LLLLLLLLLLLWLPVVLLLLVVVVVIMGGVLLMFAPLPIIIMTPLGLPLLRVQAGATSVSDGLRVHLVSYVRFSSSRPRCF
jgi:hypothetical protein